jgi:5-methylcytosine-specific restriction endonuclease McrA
MSAHTLTVDASAKPIGLIPVETAIAYLATATVEGNKKVQALVSDEQRIYHSQHLNIPAPIVLMWQDYIELEQHELRHPSHRVMFARDRYTCQYCGYQATPGKARKELTMDHVKPAHLFTTRLEATVWSNVTTACQPCNARKGGHLPMEVHMMPRTTPKEPHFVQVRFAGRLNEMQRDYVVDYFNLKGKDINL